MPRPADEARIEGLLDRSADRFEAGRLEEALAAAEEACSLEPRSVAAHHHRAAALAELGSLEDAEDAYARALELDPDDPETILSFADLLVTRLGEDRDRLERGLGLLRRGVKLARKGGDARLVAELLLLEGIAHNQLGDAATALSRIDAALPALGRDVDALVERGTALFELCRFAEAEKQLEEVLRHADEPWAHHYLGLVAERRGQAKEAERRFARARKLAPEEFPARVALTSEAFDKAVEDALEELPEKVRRYLSNVAIAVEDIPQDDDLTASDPPLSPQILGIFRGAPWRDKGIMDPWAHFPSSIVLYQKNLERFAQDREDLIEQIGITLIHEVGHFLGFDEDELRDRGLE